MNGRRQLLRGMAVTIVGMALAGGCADEKKQPQTTMSIDPANDELEADASVDPGNAAIIDGSVTYLQRIALPKGATVVVELFEISGATAATRIAHQRFTAETQVPIRFQLTYDRRRIDPARTYGLRARITVDGALWFVNDQPVLVLTRGNPASAQILLRRASASE